MSTTPAITSPLERALRVAFLGAAAIIAASGMGAAGAAASDLVVRYDQSQVLRLPRNPQEIIVGNPSIADVTIQGGNLLVITGKTFGITNIIALDGERNIIQDQRVIVERDDRRVVNLHKGAQRQSYSCTPNCQPTLTIGDETAYFDTINRHNQVKTKFSETGGGGDSQNGGQ